MNEQPTDKSKVSHPATGSEARISPWGVLRPRDFVQHTLAHPDDRRVNGESAATNRPAVDPHAAATMSLSARRICLAKTSRW